MKAKVLKKIVINGEVVSPDEVIEISEGEFSSLSKREVVSLVSDIQSVPAGEEKPAVNKDTEYSSKMSHAQLDKVASNLGVIFPQGLKIPEKVAFLDKAANKEVSESNEGVNTVHDSDETAFEIPLEDYDSDVPPPMLNPLSEE